MPISIDINFAAGELTVDDLHSQLWATASEAVVDKYWSGEAAPAGRRFTARFLWTETSLFVRFHAECGEPPVTTDEPDVTKKTIGLWDFDVCEIFIAPDRREPRRYFEFEAAPTGHWLDVAIDLTTGTRLSDWDYRSGMRTASAADEASVVTVIEIPWQAVGGRPNAGDIWAGNLFRCVGTDPGRGYLAWSPTLTPEPNFHVPERFGEFRFTN